MQEVQSGSRADSPTADQSSDDVQVLEFKLNDEIYCVDIDYVSEIVDSTDLTVVPGAPPYVEGVIDLRGRTTTITNPKTALGLPRNEEGKRIVIFNSERLGDGKATGWIVDEVYQVMRISMDHVDESPFADDQTVQGVVKREGQLLIWINPERVGA